MDNIILIGMPGSGKSSVGAVLANTLGYDFLDVDLLIQHRYGAPLQELLNAHGVDWFLQAEADVITSVRCCHSVIAPGGSCIYQKPAVNHLRSLGTVVYLQLTVEEAEPRIHNMDTRGIALQPGETFREVYDYRTPLYETCAHITVPVHNQCLEETVESVMRALGIHAERKLWTIPTLINERNSKGTIE